MGSAGSPDKLTRTVYRGGRAVPDADAPDADAPDAELTWVQLSDPTSAGMARAAEEFGLPELLVVDAVSGHQRPKLDRHGEVVQVVLKPVHYVDREEVVEVTEVVLFLGPRFLLTVQHGATDIPQRAHAALDADPGPALTATDVLVRVVRMVIDQYEDAIDGLRNDVEEIEETVFGPAHGDHAERIYKLKREVAEFRRAVDPLGRVLDRLANQSHGLEAESAPHFGSAHHHLLQVADAIDGLDRLLSDVLAANMARVTAKQSEIAIRQNEDMRKISAWAAIALVPTAVAGIYGMNFKHMPELQWRIGYPMAIGVIAIVCLALYRTFRRNKWL